MTAAITLFLVVLFLGGLYLLAPRPSEPRGRRERQRQAVFNEVRSRSAAIDAVIEQARWQMEEVAARRKRQSR